MESPLEIAFGDYPLGFSVGLQDSIKQAKEAVRLLSGRSRGSLGEDSAQISGDMYKEEELKETVSSAEAVQLLEKTMEKVSLMKLFNSAKLTTMQSEINDGAD